MRRARIEPKTAPSIKPFQGWRREDAKKLPLTRPGESVVITPFLGSEARIVAYETTCYQNIGAPFTIASGESGRAGYAWPPATCFGAARGRASMGTALLPGPGHPRR